MKNKSILKYETTTGKSFKALSDRIADNEYFISDLVEMIWIQRMDENPELKLEDAIDPEQEFEDLIKTFASMQK